MLRQYHPEIGEKQVYDDTAQYNAFIGKWVLRTRKPLNGQGIKLYEIAQYGVKIYHVTPKAFNKLCNRMNIDQRILFD